MFGFLFAQCGSCDAFVLSEIDNDDPEHVTCRSCGAKLIPFTEPGTVMKGKIWRNELGGKKDLLSKMRVAFLPQHSRNGALARREMTVDRHNDRYFEMVTMCDTGEVIHLCEEALTAHRGHCSARKPAGTPGHAPGEVGLVVRGRPPY